MSVRGVFEKVSDAVGDTPMVRLRRAVPGFAGAVYAKLEYMNPMGSVKDRIARHMVEQAMADGRLAAGGTVVEASSGNTAMGLAMMAIEYGLRCVMVVRKQTSPEKIDALRAMGVELVLVDGDLAPEHPDSYNRMARRLAAEIPGAFFPDQHNDRANNEAHYRSTGPEIWRQMEGRIDWFVAGIGTGGTVSGVARYLKEQDPKVKVMAVDIAGSVFTDHFKHGRRVTPSRTLVEGPGRRGDHRLPRVGAPRRHGAGDRPRSHPRRPRARPHRGRSSPAAPRAPPSGASANSRPASPRPRVVAPEPASPPSSPTPATATSRRSTATPGSPARAGARRQVRPGHQPAIFRLWTPSRAAPGGDSAR
jgi:cystathionine beta-synthase